MIECKEYALRILSFKDRTEAEMRKKIREKGYDENNEEEVIEFLKEYGYINDLRYAQKFASDAQNLKKWGRLRIEKELSVRGIPREIIYEVTEENDACEEDILNSEMKKRFSGVDFSNKKERARVFSYFARRGFSSGEIFGAMNKVCSFEDIETEYAD